MSIEKEIWKIARKFTGFHKFCGLLYNYAKTGLDKYKEDKLKKQGKLHPTASIGKNTIIWGNVKIGKKTYMNEAFIQAGKNSKIIIGDYCAISQGVHIRSKTYIPPLSKEPKTKEKDIIIGDYVWIGRNAFITDGVTIGHHSVIGANSVVTKDIPAYSLAAGMPAKVIKKYKKA